MSHDPQDCFEAGVTSSCCGARIMLGDLCCKCKEHCDAEKEEEIENFSDKLQANHQAYLDKLTRIEADSEQRFAFIEWLKS